MKWSSGTGPRWLNREGRAAGGEAKTAGGEANPQCVGLTGAKR